MEFEDIEEIDSLLEKKISASIEPVDYPEFYRSNKSGLNAMTFHKVRSKMIKYIKDADCPPKYKILFGDWLFRSIGRMNSRNIDIDGELLDPLEVSFHKTTVNPLLRGLYLRYTNDIALESLVIRFYENRHTDFSIQILNDQKLFSLCIFDPPPRDELRDHFVGWYRQLVDYNEKSNMIEILLQNFPTDPEVQELYERLRFDREEINGRRNLRKVYDDSQNVHDHDINKSVLKAIDNLMIDYNSYKDKLDCLTEVYMINNVLAKLNIETSKKIYSSVLRIHRDISYINTGSRSVNLADLFTAVVDYIFRSKYKDDLAVILKDEMIAMADMCNTGHLSRLINVLQGYEERYTIGIGFEKQLYAAISHRIQKKMNEPDIDENIILGSIDSEFESVYFEFLKSTVNNTITEIIDDYGWECVEEYLPGVLEKLTGDNDWILLNRKLEKKSLLE